MGVACDSVSKLWKSRLALTARDVTGTSTNVALIFAGTKYRR